MENARSARNWFLERTCNKAAISQHFIGITNNFTAAKEFGLAEANLFSIWDWVGGRYSLWSPVGCLPLALQFGEMPVRALLKGARAMDEHFATAPFENNLPVLLALVLLIS